MKFVPLTEMTDEQWYKCHLTTYNQELGYHMGVEPALIANPPKLTDFYQNITNAYDADMFRAWAILDNDDKFLGQVILDKSATGEWEVGTVLADRSKWNSGIGTRATVHAMRHAFFEEGAEWVVAFANGRDGKVRDLLIRGGFRPLMNFLVMDKQTFKDRWVRER